MKKKLAFWAVVAVFGAIQLGASAESVMGFVYKEASEPGGGSGPTFVSKTGCAQCISYFGIVARGDCSLAKAMKNGKISNLSYYDQETVNILGYKKLTVKAYGN